MFLNVRPLCKTLIWLCCILFLVSILAWLYYLQKDKDRILDMKCNGEEARSECENDFGGVQRVLFWVMIVLGILAALFIAVEYQSITSTGAMFAQISVAVKRNPSLYVVPLLQLVVGFGVSLFFLATLIFSSSVGEVDLKENVADFPGGKLKTIEYSNLFTLKGAILVVMLFWWLEFISRVGQMVVAGTISIWFFRADDITTRTRRSAYFVFRYHLGSALLAAVIIPIAMPFRALFGILRALIGRWKSQSSCGNCMVSMFSCCLEIYEKALKFVYSHACIHVVIWGDALGWSGSRAFYIMQKAGDSAKSNTIESLPHLDSINTLVMYITRLLVAFLGALFSYGYLMTKDETYSGEDTDNIESTFTPALISLVASYYLADYTLGLFDNTASTILQCLATEFSVFKGEQFQPHEELRAFVDNFLAEIELATKVVSASASSKPLSTGKGGVGMYSSSAFKGKKAVYEEAAEEDEEDDDEEDPYEGLYSSRNINGKAKGLSAFKA
mmetsp:Transcript_35482/g.40307  ORF Transcript_35482/g.40307 Transcript_35482/m.40307 type:complete len:501 (+) Transcript_35482:1-1503(+)